jgi:hypothetical protein
MRILRNRNVRVYTKITEYPGSILGQVILMRRLLRPQWLLHPRILIFPIDKPQNLRIHITSIKAHFVLSSISRRRLKRPPIQSTLRKSLPIKWGGNCLTYTHPQVSQKLNEISRSPQMYCLVTAFGFVSILTSSGW